MVRYEIVIAAVPRTYRDELQFAIEAAQLLKLLNLKEEVKVLDMETQQWMLIKDDHSKPEWRDPIWKPMVTPILEA